MDKELREQPWKRRAEAANARWNATWHLLNNELGKKHPKCCYKLLEALTEEMRRFEDVGALAPTVEE